MSKCKCIRHLFAVIMIAIMILSLSSCDVIAPILDKVGIDVSGIVGDKNEDENGDENQGTPGDNNQGTPGDNNQENPGDNTGDNQDDPVQCEHEWGEDIIVATPVCGTDEKGIIASVCTKCSARVETEFDARDSHELVRTVVREVKCGEDGLEREECTYCDYSCGK